MSKYVFVTGGVMSSVGKGIVTASLGRLLKSRGLSVTLQKCDPYLNVDPGTMNPFQHGEVFVTDDGAETDLDLGHYERFVDVNLGRANNVTAGQIYYTVVTRERRGDYLGKTVQVIPHVTDEIKDRMHTLARQAEVAIVEIGGTVGDIESLPFLEAIRQVRLEEGPEDVAFIHVTHVPYLGAAAELKTKPTQHSVKALREIGLQPDLLVCRVGATMSEDVRRKIALFCSVRPECVIEDPDAESIYEVPLLLAQNGLDEQIVRILKLSAHAPDLAAWREVVRRIREPETRVRIGVVGKYVHLRDSYKSLAEALIHGGIANECQVDVAWIDAEELSREGAEKALAAVDGVLVPGGFGDRGIEGKLAAIRCARERKIPFFGICLGMQCAVTEFARNVLGLRSAGSDEFGPDVADRVIHFLPGQAELRDKGATMRLGGFPCRLAAGSRARAAYGEDDVRERHRHRYEVNNDYLPRMQAAGLRVTGVCPGRDLVEIMELDGHPWFLGVQFHPELRSRPERPHPLFTAFVRAALEARRGSPGLRAPSEAGEEDADSDPETARILERSRP